MTRPLDTSDEQLERYYDALRKLTVGERMRIVNATTRRVRTFAEAGIRREHPSATDLEVRIRLAVRLYGREAAARIAGWVPEDAR